MSYTLCEPAVRQRVRVKKNGVQHHQFDPGCRGRNTSEEFRSQSDVYFQYSAYFQYTMQTMECFSPPPWHKTSAHRTSSPLACAAIFVTKLRTWGFWVDLQKKHDSPGNCHIIYIPQWSNRENIYLAKVSRVALTRILWLHAASSLYDSRPCTHACDETGSKQRRRMP